MFKSFLGESDFYKEYMGDYDNAKSGEVQKAANEVRKAIFQSTVIIVATAIGCTVYIRNF